MKVAKILVVLLAVIIIALFAVLIFYPGPAKAPVTAWSQPIVSADGHLAVT